MYTNATNKSLISEDMPERIFFQKDIRGYLMVAEILPFIKFCEPAYHRVTFVAEFWNTFSSFAYCIPAIHFWMLTGKYAKALPECFSVKVTWRYKVSAACWFILGLGSAAFHAFQTLWAEMWDEVGMIISVLSLSFCMFDLHPLTTSRRGNWFYGALTLSVLAALLIYIQIMYHPFFAATFLVAAFTALLISWTMPINMNKLPIKIYEESGRGPSRAAKAARDIALKTSHSLSLFSSLNMNTGVLTGVLISILGYAIWHIDQKCVTEGWKPSTTYPYEYDLFYWAHPVWHLCTAIGSLFFFDAMLKVRVEMYMSPLVRRPLTGSFVPMFSFTSSIKAVMGIPKPKSS
jgi:hypothetical protein